jgi:hypothetical protein
MLNINAYNTTGTYCEGFKKGYTEGWCFDKYNCTFLGIVPMCPMIVLDEDTYKDGYKRGFALALKKRP